MSAPEPRPATLADLDGLHHLETACFDDAWSAASLRTALEDPRYVVLAAGPAGAPVGYILGWTVGDEGEIARLAVMPAMRRHGLGRTLLQACRTEMNARGAVDLFLDVRAGNAAALALYRGYGFEEVAQRRAY